ncbi:MAG: hypothetical protein ACLRWH_01425 [Emergencia sp.]
MGIQTDRLGAYVSQEEVNLSKLSRDTGIPYISIYDSLRNKNSRRDLRTEEFFKICKVLKLNPMDFADKE